MHVILNFLLTTLQNLWGISLFLFVWLFIISVHDYKSYDGLKDFIHWNKIPLFPSIAFLILAIISIISNFI